MPAADKTTTAFSGDFSRSRVQRAELRAAEIGTIRHQIRVMSEKCPITPGDP
jgi:hypothetical protein